MWFLLGMLCGVAACGMVLLCLPKGKRPTDVEKSDRIRRTPPKEWAQTRNFLYYDGTVMPEIKEDANEQ